MGQQQVGRRLLRCQKCQRIVECTATELLHFARIGWPTCCGEVMGYYVETERPAAGEPMPSPPEGPTS